MKAKHSVKKILVVDDEADMRIFVSTVAETNGYEAISAETGQQALEMAWHHRPDLVILDVMMPKIEDGIHTFHQFKSDAVLKDTPVIMLSAIAQKTFFHYVKLLNPVAGDNSYTPEGYVEKPPDAEDLIQLIQSII
ncbi:MAG: response regulator [Desulfobacterales bacterium]|jgi:CheY-like chemotaxis protein|nr:response regulator [Desulfobacterales bacterium]